MIRQTRGPILKLFSQSESVIEKGLTLKDISQSCSFCGGTGREIHDMGFLPNIIDVCKSCKGTGLSLEIRDLTLFDKTLAELYSLSLTEIYSLFKDFEIITRKIKPAIDI